MSESRQNKENRISKNSCLLLISGQLIHLLSCLCSAEIPHHCIQSKAGDFLLLSVSLLSLAWFISACGKECDMKHLSVSLHVIPLSCTTVCQLKQFYTFGLHIAVS